MHCPFLRKLNVKYCGLYGMKLIPLSADNDTAERCLSRAWLECSLVRDSVAARRPAGPLSQPLRGGRPLLRPGAGAEAGSLQQGGCLALRRRRSPLLRPLPGDGRAAFTHHGPRPGRRPDRHCHRAARRPGLRPQPPVAGRRRWPSRPHRRGRLLHRHARQGRGRDLPGPPRRCPPLGADPRRRHGPGDGAPAGPPRDRTQCASGRRAVDRVRRSLRPRLADRRRPCRRAGRRRRTDRDVPTSCAERRPAAGCAANAIG